MVLLLAAMDAEIEALVEALDRRTETSWHGFIRYRGYLEGREVLVAKTGVGKSMAALVVQALIDETRPEAMVFTGLAGSLRSHIRIGDTIIARDLVQHDIDATVLGFPLGSIPYTDFRFLAADPDLFERALSYRPPAGTVHAGRIGTGDQFVTADTLAARPSIIQELSCDAVEMEGASAALVCAINRVPFVVARTVSDMADGSAHVDFASFLVKASVNSLGFARHVLRGIALS